MLCDNCKKNIATTHIKTVVNSVTVEKHLCSSCAVNGGYLVNNGFVDMLSAFLGENIGIVDNKYVKCDCCGSTFSDIAKTGKAGCAECYKTFKNEFDKSLYRIHGNSAHIGKKPKNIVVSIDENVFNNNLDLIEDLKIQLKESIKAVKYEKAAVIRDKIKEIEGSEKNE